MSYSILRLERVKNHNDVSGIMKHIERLAKEYTNIDIDKFKSAMNYDLLYHQQAFENYNMRIEKRLEEGYKGKRKVRSDAIKLVDGLITSDDVFFDGMNDQQVKTFFEDALEFIKVEYGEENIMYATVHLDEKTPHLHFGFVPLTADGRLSAKEVLGNKKKMSLLQDKYHAFINAKGYEMQRGERAIDTERQHVEMNKYKEQTAYHKKELDHVEKELNDVTADYNKALEKWGKAHELDVLVEKESFTTIVVPKGEHSMPNVEIKEKRFGRTEIDKEQVEDLQEWGKGAIDLIKKQQKAMENKDSEIERLHGLVRLQEEEVDEKVERKYKSEIERYKSRNEKIVEENMSLKQRNKETIDDLYEAQRINEHLNAEISVLKRFRNNTIRFIEKFDMRAKFERFVGKLKDAGRNL